MTTIAGTTPADRRGRGATPTLARRVSRHAVALVSLCVALGGLGYNTWRNETTEAHRNVRQAAFVLLEQLGQLQQVVDERYYAGRADATQRIRGWGKVALVRDLGMLVSPESSMTANRLFGSWQDQVDRLDEGDAGAEREISSAIARAREQVLRDLEALR